MPQAGAMPWALWRHLPWDFPREFCEYYSWEVMILKWRFPKMVVPLNHAVIHVRKILNYIPTTLGVPIYGNPHLGKLKHPCNDRSGQRLATKIDRSPSSLPRKLPTDANLRLLRRTIWLICRGEAVRWGTRWTGLWREAVFKVFCAICFFAASKITYKQFLTQKKQVSYPKCI